ncbi:hypothetical protein K1719_040045 [Acacia pycnantha]|nr:hypothetical protein K1719_040045 [Acacia pycnantha]
MTDEQKQVFDQIMNVVSSKEGGFFFLQGFGGTGKTFIWNALTASVRSNGGIILNVASSGIAATLLPSGCVPIMLLRNIDQAAGLCNGTRLQIKQLGKNVIKAKALNGTSIGEDILIHIMDMNPSEAKLPFTMTRRQFPIIISFAMTINKSQGQSMANVGLYLPSPVFPMTNYMLHYQGSLESRSLISNPFSSVKQAQPFPPRSLATKSNSETLVLLKPSSLMLSEASRSTLGLYSSPIVSNENAVTTLRSSENKNASTSVLAQERRVVAQYLRRSQD